MKKTLQDLKDSQTHSLIRQPKKCEYLISNVLSDENVFDSLGDNTIELTTKNELQRLIATENNAGSELNLSRATLRHKKLALMSSTDQYWCFEEL